MVTVTFTLLNGFLAAFCTLPLISQFPWTSRLVLRSMVLNLFCCRLHWRSFATWQICLVSSNSRNDGDFPACLWYTLSVKKFFIIFEVTGDSVDFGSWYSRVKNTGFQLLAGLFAFMLKTPYCWLATVTGVTEPCLYVPMLLPSAS